MGYEPRLLVIIIFCMDTHRCTMRFFQVAFVVSFFAFSPPPLFAAQEPVELNLSHSIEGVSFLDGEKGWIVSNSPDGKGSVLDTLMEEMNGSLSM